MTDPVAPRKVDPETLVLRAQPRRIVRFKRHVLVASAAIGCVSLFGVTWLALGASAPKVVAQPETFNPDKVADTQKARPETLTALPQAYDQLPAGVPRLGPPLPGDLGGPILEHQRAQVSAVSSSGPHPGGQPDAPLINGIFFQVSPPAVRTAETAGDVELRTTEARLLALPRSVVEPPLPAKPAFVDRKGYSGIYNSHQLETQASPYQVMAGTVITASLVTGLKSDLPGFVIAQVTQPVFDTVSGRFLLIPQGTRLIGQYDDQVSARSFSRDRRPL